MNTKIQTAYGEYTIDELVYYTELWKQSLEKQNNRKRIYNRTEEGKQKNNTKAKQYYEKHKEEILAKRKQKYQALKDKPQFIDE